MYNRLFSMKAAVTVLATIALAGCATYPNYTVPADVETTDITFIDSLSDSRNQGWMSYQVSVGDERYHEINDFEDEESAKNIRVYENQVPLNTNVRIRAEYHIANWRCSVSTLMNFSEPMDYHVYSNGEYAGSCRIGVFRQVDGEWVLVPSVDAESE
ncbi:hypothetical protein ABMA57_15320 [Saccharospirillum sp. HFRX-1]|uniref:hypothetical protein n=1 Tax=unclassified Saccharospirillum TaxID=2633430 RepID=UPI0037130E7B